MTMLSIFRYVLGNIKQSKLSFLIISVAIMLVAYYFYNVGSHAKISAMNNNEHYKPQANIIQKHSANHAGNTPYIKQANVLDKKITNRTLTAPDTKAIDVMVTFTKAEHNYHLVNKFKTTVSSLFRFSSIPINLYILGDEFSVRKAETILSLEVPNKSKYMVIHLNIDELVKNVHEIVSEMQKYFSFKPGAYYSDSLFFMSMVMHRVLPDLRRVIMLDCDLKFNADIGELYSRFDLFTDENIIGIARDAQPVYRHNFHMYRNQNKGTRVGDPPPNGLTGFNSGVLLLDLDKMRHSHLYNSLLTPAAVKNLTEKYMFKGHLGDQDFYSLIFLENEHLFHILPCSWNRQLCQWWKNNGYADVFDQYFTCPGKINIYHGNCNTEIPKLEWES